MIEAPLYQTPIQKLCFGPLAGCRASPPGRISRDCRSSLIGKKQDRKLVGNGIRKIPEGVEFHPNYIPDRLALSCMALLAEDAARFR